MLAQANCQPEVRVDAETKKGIAANIVVIALGGRKMFALGLCLAAVCWGPEAGYGTVVTLFGLFVGGNGVEWFMKRGEKPEEDPPAAPVRSEAVTREVPVYAAPQTVPSAVVADPTAQMTAAIAEARSAS